MQRAGTRSGTSVIARAFIGIILVRSLASPQLSRPVEVDNGLLKISFNSISKTWSLYENQTGGWLPVITGATMSVSFRDRDSLVLTGGQITVTAKSVAAEDRLGKGRAIDVSAAGDSALCSLRLLLYDGRKAASVWGRLRNKSGETWKLKSFHLVDLQAGGALLFGDERVFVHLDGYQSWNSSDVVRLDSSTQVRSYWSALFYQPDLSSSLLLGFPGNRNAVNWITSGPLDASAGRSPLLTSSEIGTVELSPGAEMGSDTLLLTFDPSPTVNLERFAETMSAVGPAITKPLTPAGRGLPEENTLLPVPAGWCSWYHYYQHISEDSILANVRFAARHLKDAGLRIIQVDDGYQIAAGDWETNKRFPHGHRWLVDEIHRSGFQAGLWIAPFAVAESSSLFREHRDWLLKDSSNSPKEFFRNDWWGGRIFSLDPTIPAVQHWLEVLLSRITHQWGYDYVKIDFVYFAGEGVKYSRNVSSAQALETGLRALRRGAGSEKYLLGCGAPIGPSAGYFDGMRIGTDVEAGWSGALPGCTAAAQRYFYHRTVWYDDPDCLLLGEPLTLDEARMWAGVLALSGQMIMAGDDLTALPPDRLDLLRMTLPVYDGESKPVDMFAAPKPEGLTLIGPDGKTFGLPHVWKFRPGDSLEWKEPDADDSAWGAIPVPARWEDHGYPSLDGYAWYRVKFTLPPEWMAGDATLFLGMIDDCDQTYLNGSLIGESGSFPPNYSTAWTSFRAYRIPLKVLRPGSENVLAVRVYDGGGAGGIYRTRQLSIPSLWTMSVDRPFEKWKVAGLFNWSDSASTMLLTAEELGLSAHKKYLLYELWSDQYLGVLEGEMNVTVGPRSSKVISIHEAADRPIVLSTSRHITQGAVDLAKVEWDPAARVLSVVSEKLLRSSYTAVIHVPEGMAVARVVSPSRSEVFKISDDVVKVKFQRVPAENFAWKVVFRER